MSTNYHRIGRLYVQKGEGWYHYHLLKLSGNGASTISGLSLWILKVLWNSIDPYSMYLPSQLAKMLLTKLLPPPTNEHQRSVNNFWSPIIDNLGGLERHWFTLNLLAACIGKNASDNIVYASYNWAPMGHPQSLWGLITLHSNELHRYVTELSITQSVRSISPCIQLHKYQCNVSQISHCLLLALESECENPHSTAL